MRAKMRHNKQSKENVPAVTWIRLLPPTTSRTSLKSVSDYLSETPDETPMPKRRLRLSPETLTALDRAEKLVDDVERQIANMNYNTYLVDELENEKLDNEKFRNQHIYIRNVVASTFEKGYYDPGPRSFFDGDNKSKFKLSRSKPIHPTVAQSFPDTVKSTAVQATKKPIDCCLVCKSSKTDKPPEPSNVIKDVAEEKINDDKPEKLNVQKGPAISIQADLSIQTKRIIDIQPVEPALKTGSDEVANIVTYEFRHASCATAPSLDTDETPRTPERQVPPLRRLGETYSKRDRSSSRRKKVDAEQSRRLFDSQSSAESLDFDLGEFSLTEPMILTDVDMLLEQQRKIIREVHNATERFDRFLLGRVESEVTLEFERNRLPMTTVFRHVERNKAPVLRTSGGSEMLMPVVKDRTLVKPPSIFNSPISADKVASSVGKISSTSADTSSKSSSIHLQSRRNNSADSKSHRKATEDSVVESEESSTEKSKDEEEHHHSERFESEISTNSDSRSKGASNPQQQPSIANELSPNLSLTSIHTRTKSSAGFIENLKSVQSLKDHNLSANVQSKDHLQDTPRIVEGRENSQESQHGTSSDKTKSTNNETENRSVKELQQEEKEKDDNSTTEDEEENKKDDNTEKSLEQLDRNSQKTLHLIESISEISFPKISGDSKSSLESLSLSKLSQLSQGSKIEGKEAANEESEKEKSTESKIESKLSEARGNLNSLMKSMSISSDSQSNNGEELNNKGSDKNLDRMFVSPMKVQNNVARNENLDEERRESVVVSNLFRATQEHNVSDTRSLMTMLEENSSIVFETQQQQKLRLLRRLESCSIPSQYRGTELFTSTVLGGVEAPNSFAKMKGSSDMSSETHSEGEVILNSSASYSLGEVRKKIEYSRINSNAKDSSSSNANYNTKSIGEVSGPQ